jgi:N utilization substance protein A
MSSELIQALHEIEKERGIPQAALVEAIKTALNTATVRTLAQLKMLVWNLTK